MNNECIIKLIGHRPVYRVVRDRLPEAPNGMASLTSSTEATTIPLFDRDERHRMLSGTPRDGWDAS